jgi:hypothetical protein
VLCVGTLKECRVNTRENLVRPKGTFSNFPLEHPLF